MNELIAWLRSIIQTDLAKATAANDRSVEWAAQYAGDCALEAEAEHIRSNLPRGAIVRCEAELAILDEHPVTTTSAIGEDLRRVRVEVCQTCGNRSGVPCRTVRLLAYGYRYREGYREEWAP